jgi:ribosomal protein L18E
LQEVAARMGDVVTAYLAELKEEDDQGLVIVACVVTSARKHITKEKKLMMFAQVEDLTGSVEATIFPRTYEATAAVWNADEILLVLGRVEKRDDVPKLLVEHAVRFSDAGSIEIRRALTDTTERLAKRAKFVRPGGGAGFAGPANAGPSPRPVAPPVSPTSPQGRPVELVIRFREAMSYEKSVEIFKRISEVLKDFSGASAVVLELPNPKGQARRVSTPFRANLTAEVAEAVEREVGRDVIEVVLPGR